MTGGDPKGDNEENGPRENGSQKWQTWNSTCGQRQNMRINWHRSLIGSRKKMWCKKLTEDTKDDSVSFRLLGFRATKGADLYAYTLEGCGQNGGG